MNTDVQNLKKALDAALNIIDTLNGQLAYRGYMGLVEYTNQEGQVLQIKEPELNQYLRDIEI